jgi:hypothetical protein
LKDSHFIATVRPCLHVRRGEKPWSGWRRKEREERKVEERGKKEKGRCPIHTNFFFVEGVKRQKALSKSLIVRIEREIDIKGEREKK